MALFTFNVGEESETFFFREKSVVSTECATQFVYEVIAPDGDQITFGLSATGFTPVSWVLQSYRLNGVEYTDWTGITIKTVTMATELLLRFSIENSDTPGQFNTAKILVTDQTLSKQQEKEVSRENDSGSCTASGSTFDQLVDTPINKTADALKLVRVNAAGTDLEYVSPGTLGVDLNYTHVQASSSTWVIAHSLGKIPSVTVIDSSGNKVNGDVAYTDLNNLTISFNTAFAGTAYLN